MLFLQNVPDLPESTEHFRTDLSRDLAALHEICVTHSDELRTLSNERGAQQVYVSLIMHDRKKYIRHNVQSTRTLT